MSDDPRADFELFLDMAGSGAATGRRRSELGIETFLSVDERWRGRFGATTTRAEILAVLGPADREDAHSLAYHLDGRPGYAYRFVLDDARGLLLRRCSSKCTSHDDGSPVISRRRAGR